MPPNRRLTRPSTSSARCTSQGEQASESRISGASTRCMTSGLNLFAQSHHDGLRDPVVNRLASWVHKILKETGAGFQQRGSVAQSSLEGVPEANALVNHRHDANTGQPFAQGSPVRHPHDWGKVDYRENRAVPV